MKIICTQENLSRGLQLVSHIASKNISLPILGNVMIKAEGNVITLMATNLEVGISCNVRGKIERTGAFTVQARTLSDYVSLLPKENVTIELTEQGLKIECRGSKTVMKGADASEFPLIPNVEERDAYSIQTQMLRGGLSSAAFAVALDETRPEISGVYFLFEGKALVLAATDSYRLAEKKLTLEKEVAKKQHVIVPLKTVQELVRILSAEDSEATTVVCSENQILFSFGGTKLTSRVIEGQYPDYRQIIPQEHRTHAVVSTAEFINTVKRASLFCKPGSNDIALKFNAASKEIVVSTTNVQVGESEAKQEAAIEGEDNGIVFNYRFLLDGLQNIDEEECVLEINTNMNPGLLKPQGSDTYLYIIMPIKQ